MLDVLQTQHDMATAQHQSVTQVRDLLDATRVQMDKLLQLGDLVTPEDVIKGAGELAGAGASPMELAKLLSDMPQDGPGLQQWLQTNDRMVTQKEAALKPAVTATRHAMGLSAMRLLVAHAMGAPQTSSQPSPDIATQPAGGNALAPQGPAQSDVQV